MMKFLPFLFLLFCNVGFAQLTDIRINELDQDQPGSDTLEFVELYGAPNTPLDGLVLVFFNGAGDVSYDVYDLAGQSTDESGFFVLGSSFLAASDMFLTPNAQGSIQNGQDAIALYLGTAADWPAGTAVSSNNLVDAIVYSSNDGPDDVLSAALTPGQAILDVAGNSTLSFSRVPDGGAALDLSTYVLQAPTPGASNIPLCWGGEVSLVNGNLQQCSDTINDPIVVSNSSLFGINYIYVLADTNNAIISWYVENTLDMDQLEDGVYWVYGVSFNGDIDEATLSPGSNISGMMAAECLSVSTNFLEIIRETCGIEPPTNTILDVVVNSDVHNTLEAAVLAAGLQGALSGPGPLTLFAPTDAAFAALPAGTIDALLADPTGLLTEILMYHVVGAVALSSDLADGMMITTLNGQAVMVTINANGIFINNAQVIVADIIADNGVVHVIDAVLLPPGPQPTNTILDIVVDSPDHNTLEAAVLAAGLQGALSGPGPLTLFAPTDAAFAALPAGTIDALLADPTGLLTEILMYHVVGAVALSSDLADGMMITTLNGQAVMVTINANGIFINNAQVIVADIIADNGVVHVIDAVLLPVPSVIASAVESPSSFQLFPNPAEGTLFIQSESGINQWIIRDMQGRMVLSGNNSSGMRTAIPIDLLEAGSYFIQFEDRSGAVNMPFIKR
jgi:uncharacterized surface protein with fasciclin (FAS1) repeats